MRLIRPLQEADAKSGFTCGVSAIDEFLAKRAWGQHSRHEANRVWVLANEETHEVLGIYSLSVREIERVRLRGVVPGSAPPRPLGVFYIGYFAVALTHQGTRLGTALMRDALRRCIVGAEAFGVVGVFLDSLNPRSTNFYRRLGFEEILRSAQVPEDTPQPMFISMRTLVAARGP